MTDRLVRYKYDDENEWIYAPLSRLIGFRFDPDYRPREGAAKIDSWEICEFRGHDADGFGMNIFDLEIEDYSTGRFVTPPKC